MLTVARALRPTLRLLLAAVLLGMLPFVGLTPKAAAVVEHTMHAHQTEIGTDCAAVCARAAAASLPTQAVLDENETRLPDPEPREGTPRHLQLQAIHTPAVLRPSAAYSTLPSKPPDILTWSAYFRL